MKRLTPVKAIRAKCLDCSCGNTQCKSAGKHPMTKNGFKDATTDEKQVGRWWEMRPRANIGIPTGSASGLIVLDVDEGGDGELKKHSPLPENVESNTGSGGRHIFFKNPKNLKITNKVGLFKGLDIRGEDGYVVAPPSYHKSGKRYK